MDGIQDRWRVDEAWWRPEAEQIVRMDFELRLADGDVLTVYHDRLRDTWHEQRY